MTTLRHIRTCPMLIAVLADGRLHGSRRYGLPRERFLASRRSDRTLAGRPRALRGRGLGLSRPLAPLAKGRVMNKWRQRKTCVRSAATTHSHRRRPYKGRRGSGGLHPLHHPQKWGLWASCLGRVLRSRRLSMARSRGGTGSSVLLRRPWHGHRCSSAAAGRRLLRLRIRTCPRPVSTVVVAQRRPTSHRHADPCDRERCVGHVVTAATRPTAAKHPCVGQVVGPAPPPPRESCPAGITVRQRLEGRSLVRCCPQPASLMRLHVLDFGRPRRRGPLDPPRAVSSLLMGAL